MSQHIVTKSSNSIILNCADSSLVSDGCAGIPTVAAPFVNHAPLNKGLEISSKRNISTVFGKVEVLML